MTVRVHDLITECKSNLEEAEKRQSTCRSINTRKRLPSGSRAQGY